VFFLLNCGSNPVSSTNDITVSTPSSGTVWTHYDTELSISWSGGNTDNVSIDLYKGDDKVTTISGSTGNSGSFTWAGPVSDTFDPGSNYRIRIEDGIGTVGWSANFQVAECTGSEIISVTRPSSSTQWQHFQSGYLVEWNYPASRNSSGNSISIGSSGGSPTPLSGDSIKIDLYKGTEWVATITGMTVNGGIFQLTDLIPMEWGTGSNYMVKVTDNDGNFGWSSEFSINPVTGSEVITVTEPDANTTWEHNETNTQVIWNYPALNGSNSTVRLNAVYSTRVEVSPSPLSGDSVRVEIWQGSSKVGDYSSWIDNTGSYTRTEGIPGSWGDGSGFQLKVIDSYGNFGWSAEFAIETEMISISDPSSSTDWLHYEMGTQVAWDYPSGGAGADQIKIDLYRDGTEFVSFSGGFVTNSSPYTMNDPIPPSWGTSSDHTYMLRLEDNWGNYGFSDEFEILAYVIFSVTSPTSSTTWTHYQGGNTVSWDNPSGLQSDSVAIQLYKGDELVGELVPLTSNTGMVTLDPISKDYVAGTDYRVKVVDEYGDWGWSEEFTIEESSGAEIISVNTPTSSTEWEHFEVNTLVEWTYPALLNLSLFQPMSYDEVTIDLYKDGTFAGSFSGGSVPNDFSYTRADGILATWTPGDDYQIRVEDDLGNFGWSEDFTINAADAFTFSNPVSSTTWMHYQSDVNISWDYSSSDSVQIVLMQAQSPVDTLSNGMIGNTGSFTLSEVSEDWTPGSNYKIYIVDENQDYGWSDDFTVALSSGAEVISVTDPGTGTVWEHFYTGYPINWTYGQGDRESNQTTIRLLDRFGLDNPISGDEVLITLLKNSVVQDTIGGDWITNTGTYTLTEAVSYYWGVGTDYQIKITDDLGNYGIGEMFQIFGTGGEEIITVTDPTSSTTWEHYETGTSVVWDYPALDSPLYEDSVMLQVWSNGGNTFVGNYSDGWVENTGTFTRADGIPAEWSIGTDYQIKVVDDLGNFGWSESFAIENGEAITITVPNSSTTWMHYETDTSILWDSTGIAGDEVIIQLFRGTNFISTLVSGTDNDGEWINTGQIPDTWIPASNYKIKITDAYGDFGWSDDFAVSTSTGQQIYEVTTPTTGTAWTHFETDLPINWAISTDEVTERDINPTANGNRTILTSMIQLAGPEPLSGDSVTIELHKGGTLYATLTSLTDNDYSWTYAGPVPMEWDPASDYQIKITDNLGNWGISDEFTVDEVTGQEIITVTNPTSSTIWRTLEPGTQVTWEYPTDFNSDISIAIPFGGRAIERVIQANNPIFLDSISIEIWKNGSYLADYTDGIVPNIDTYTRAEGIPSSWGTGSNYQVKMIDANSNFGFSDQFSITAGEINVTQPTTGTNWNIGETGIQVNWTGGPTVVKLELWADGQLLEENFSTYITNTGSFTYPDPVPVSWDTGLHYQIRISNNDGTQQGWSEEFQISNEIDVLYPTSETIWAWSMDSLAVEWDDPFGDSVCVDIYKGGAYLDTFLPYTSNDGNEIRFQALPSSWGTGDDFQLKIVNNKGSFGWSEEFTIGAIEIAAMQTPWCWGMADREVVWGDVPGSTVRLVVCLGEDSVGCFNNPGEWLLAETGGYTREELIPSTWDEGDTYSVRIVDNEGNIGCSALLEISSFADSIVAYIPNIDNPGDIASLSGSDYLYVACNSYYSHVIDVASNSIIETTYIGRSQSGVCVSPFDDYSYITTDDGYLYIRDINLSTDNSYKISGNGLGYPILSSDGENLLVSNYLEDVVYVVDSSNGSIIEVINTPEGPCDIVITPDDQYAYIACTYANTVIKVSMNTFEIVSTIQNVTNSQCLAISPDGSRLFVGATGVANDFRVIDTNTDTVINVLALNDCSIGDMKVSPTGDYMYIGSFSPHRIVILNLNTYNEDKIISTPDWPISVCVLPNGCGVYIGCSTPDMIIKIE